MAEISTHLRWARRAAARPAILRGIALVALLAAASLAQPARAQVGIGTTVPHSSAILDLVANDRGFLPPRLTTQEMKSIPGPADGLIVYNRDSSRLYLWSGTLNDWQPLGSGQGVAAGWALQGNAGLNPVTDFIGTTDPTALIFRTDGQERMRLTPKGKVGIGTSFPGAQLEVNVGEGIGLNVYRETAGQGYNPIVSLTVGSYVDPEPAIHITHKGLGHGVSVDQGNEYGGDAFIATLAGSGNGLTVDHYGTGNLLFLRNGSGPRIVANNMGCVGIGHASPLYSLDIEGNGYMVKDTMDDPVLILDNQGSSSVYYHANRTGLVAAASDPLDAAAYGIQAYAFSKGGMPVGVYSRAEGYGTGYGLISESASEDANYGVLALATGGQTGPNYGIYAEANGTGALAAYMVGNGVWDGRLGVGRAPTLAQLDVESAKASIPAIAGYSYEISGEHGTGVWGEAVNKPGFGYGGSFIGGNTGVYASSVGDDYTGTSYGLYASSTGSAGARVGVMSTANSGCEFNSGVEAFAYNAKLSNTGGYFAAGGDNSVGVYYSSTETGLTGSGTKNAVVRGPGGPVLVYCQESPEVWFEDLGEGTIRNGAAVVEVPADFAPLVTISEEHPMRVFITPNGDMGSYWVEKHQDKFIVHAPSAADGTPFDFRLMAKRKGYEDQRLRPLPFAYSDPNLYPNVGEVPQQWRELWQRHHDGLHNQNQPARAQRPAAEVQQYPRPQLPARDRSTLRTAAHTERIMR